MTGHQTFTRQLSTINASTNTPFVTRNDTLNNLMFIPAFCLFSQVRIDGSVFTISTKMKHDFSASGITLDRKVRSVRDDCGTVEAERSYSCKVVFITDEFICFLETLIQTLRAYLNAGGKDKPQQRNCLQGKSWF